MWLIICFQYIFVLSINSNNKQIFKKTLIMKILEYDSIKNYKMTSKMKYMILFKTQ